jgi:hypothetical protein
MPAGVAWLADTAAGRGLMPRYEWGAASALPMVDQRKPAPVTVEPTPDVATNPAAPINVADGVYVASDEGAWRWWATRQPDVAVPIVHIQGWDGPHYVSESREMPGASRAKVQRLIETIIAERAAAVAKKRKGRGPAVA